MKFTTLFMRNNCLSTRSVHQQVFSLFSAHEKFKTMDVTT